MCSVLHTYRFILLILLLSFCCVAPAYAAEHDVGECFLTIGQGQRDGPHIRTLEACADMIYLQAPQDADGITYGHWNNTQIKIGPGGDIYLSADNSVWQFWKVSSTREATTQHQSLPPPPPPPLPPLPEATGNCTLVGRDPSITPFLETLEACANRIYSQAVPDSLGITYGMWMNIYIKIGPGGDIYLSDDNAVWQFWKVSSLRDTQSSSPTPQQQAGDMDGDGIPNSHDQCVDTQETFNGILDKDGCPDSLDDLLNMAIADIDGFWSQVFAKSGLQYSKPSVTAYTDSIYVAQCGGLINAGFFYCGNVHGIYYDTNLMMQQFTHYGDFAPVMVLAHEWGHAVQHLLGYTTKNRFVFQLEQSSDCLAGAYARNAAQRGILEEGDLEEAAQSLVDASDQEVIPLTRPEAHGTPPQRIIAFALGWQSGVKACLP